MNVLPFRFMMVAIIVSIIALVSVSAQDGAMVSPKTYFGFTPGEDQKLFDYEQLIDYLKKLDEASPMLKLVPLGNSPEGRMMYILFISSPENISNLNQLKTINKTLALEPGLSVTDQQKLIQDGKVFVTATLSMHSTEVGPTQAAPLIVYEWVTSDDQALKGWLNDVVYMMVPCHNPDGMDYVVNNYRKYLGTKYEGAALPRVYHKYVGHDNNRDFVILSQQDTKNIDRIFTQTWFPQVMVEKHQMGSTGPRYFVPPNSDPIAENIDAELWTWTGIFGQNMINDMTRAGQAGISQHYSFDNYWPGSTETCLWQNVIAMLTECASANVATPVYVEPNELRVGGKGLSEYKKSINMPLPWEGGWWHLGDIVQYEITSSKSILKTASLYHDKILAFRNNLCKREVEKGKSEAPYYYILPREQRDVSEWVNLLNLLKEQGVKLFTLTKDQNLDGQVFKTGDIVVPLAQPFRAFIKEAMEVQHYPVRHYSIGGDIIRPYDIASWCLPLHRQVRSVEIEKRYPEMEQALSEITGSINLLEPIPLQTKSVLFPVEWNESFKAAFLAGENGMNVERLTGDVTVQGKKVHAGSFVISARDKNKADICWKAFEKELKVEPILLESTADLPLTPMVVPRIALVETYYSDMDAGWTRFVFDTYHIPYKVLHPDQFEKTDFTGNYDVVVFPNSRKTLLLNGTSGSGNGYYMSRYAPEYAKGIGKKGMEKLMTFVEQGGHVVAWGGSTALFEGKLSITETEKGKSKSEEKKEDFSLPFRDISSQLQKEGLYIPGSLVEIKLVQGHPVTQGLPKEIGVFSRGRPVFLTSLPGFDMDRRVIATYPESGILLSGYAEKASLMGNKSALIWLKKGKGQLVLFGFNPQFRASTQASYKLLFNALLLP